MGHLIDIVGHFGTTFSYATVGARVARALLEAGLLGAVMNLDPEWHSSFEDLPRELPDGAARGSHLLLFSAPNHYVDVFAEQYGRERAAIYMSPNTDTLAPEHAMTCAKFGLSVVPSSWCHRVVWEQVPDVRLELLPLGVDEHYAKTREKRRLRLIPRMWDPCRVLHLSTDQSWPGRKGTEELLAAWAMLKAGPMRRGRQKLILHLPPALHRDAMYRIRELEISESVEIALGVTRGSHDVAVAEMFDEVDLVVAPSRCEGFGMMFLAAIVAGVPLVATYATGQRDFLSGSPGWLGVPTPDVAPMAREDGMAPVVEPGVLARTLWVAMQAQARGAMLVDPVAWGLDADESWGTWGSALPLWVSRLREWMEET